MKRIVLLGLATGLVMTGVAASKAKTKKPKSVWAGTNVSFGATINTGNTNTTDIAAGTNISYDKNRVSNTFQFQYQYGKSNDVLNKKQYNLQNQANYKFNKKGTAFVFLNETASADKFSAYEFQTLTASGLGHDVYRGADLVWTAQAGPGYRYDRIRNGGNTDDAWAGTLTTNITWDISKDAKFTTQAEADFGAQYNHYNFATALTSTLFNNFATQVSFTTDYYTQIPANSSNTKKLDTTTVFSVIYNFA